VGGADFSRDDDTDWDNMAEQIRWAIRKGDPQFRVRMAQFILELMTKGTAAISCEEREKWLAYLGAMKRE
jgi:hypothetical protein